MKKAKFLKALSATLALAMATMCFAGCGDKNYAKNNTEYYIGCTGPLTGGAAIYGIAVNNGAKMAIEEINANGGLNGTKFKFEMKDDVHDATKVAGQYSALIEEGMQVSLGTVTTAPCLEFLNYAQEDNLFFITPSATGDDVTKNYKNAYQMCFSDSSQGTYAAKYVKDNYADAKIGIFYNSSDAYSTGIFNNFMKEFNQEQKDAMEIAEFTEDEPTDVSSQVEKLKECNFIFMPIYYGPASTFMKTANDIYSADVIYFGCDGFDGINSQKGFDLNTIKQQISMLSHFDSSSTSGKSGDFVSKYIAKYGSDTLNQFGASAYDCIYAIYEAMKKAGDKISVTMSPSDMCDVLVEVFNDPTFVITGATGEEAIKWNSDGTVNKKALEYIVKAKNA